MSNDMTPEIQSQEVTVGILGFDLVNPERCISRDTALELDSWKCLELDATILRTKNEHLGI